VRAARCTAVHARKHINLTRLSVPVKFVETGSLDKMKGRTPCHSTDSEW
jgi:hypothetical protein